MSAESNLNETLKQEAVSRLANLLKFDRDVLIDLQVSESQQQYRTWNVPKIQGGFRKISAPNEKLRAVQTEILYRLLYRAPTSPFAHGFVPKRSIVTNAQVHRSANSIISLDLEDAYPSIHRDRVVHALERGIGPYLKFSFPGDSKALRRYLIERVADLCTLDQSLPQGAPTSGALLNLCCYGLDRACAKALLAHQDQYPELRYSRYADDLTFSTREIFPHEFVEHLIRLVSAEGFRINRRKIHRHSTLEGSLQICGLRIAEGNITLPRKKIKRYRAMLFQAANTDPSQLSPEDKNQLRGHLAFLRMATDVCPPALDPLLRKVMNRHRSWLFKRTKKLPFLTYSNVS